VAVVLSAENARQLWVPAGFAHGVCTLEPETIVSYKVTDYWSPAHERTLRFNDPQLNISWPFSDAEVTMNARDRDAPLLSELASWF
jgi:dTDP-4-dehydrorhamnose 3,5-epimerase